MSAQRADEILAFIRDYIESENIAPSVREICSGCGIQSPRRFIGIYTVWRSRGASA